MDVREQYEELTKQLKKIVPFEAFPTRSLVQELRNSKCIITLNTKLIIKDVYNSGDITGIVCMTERLGNEALACALTHVIVSNKNPFYKEIANYQKKRNKRTQKLNQMN